MFQFLSFMLLLGAFMADPQDTPSDHGQEIGEEVDLSWSSPQGCDVFFNYTVTCEGPNVREIPSNFPQTIVHIKFINTSVTAIPDKAFVNYPALKEIRFEYNSLKKIHKGAFSGLSNLQNLDLSRNRLSDESFGLEPFEGLASLTDVPLEFNALSTFPLHLFVNAQNLVKIVLWQNQINNIGPTLDVTFENITSIDLRYNQLKSLDASVFNQIPKLEELLLDGNAISVIESGEVFLKMDSLTKLSIGDSKIHCDCKASWMLKARDANKIWTKEWEEVIRCASPDWMKFTLILGLLPDDLTCDLPVITPITSTTTTQIIPFTIKATMKYGQPYSIWESPVGTSESDNRAPGDDYMLWAEVTSKINEEDHSVETTLEIKKYFDDYDETPGAVNKFTLTATNVAGSCSLTFSVYMSSAVGGPPVYTGTLLLMLIIYCMISME